jgi:hypothetical protein
MTRRFPRGRSVDREWVRRAWRKPASRLTSVRWCRISDWTVAAVAQAADICRNRRHLLGAELSAARRWHRLVSGKESRGLQGHHRSDSFPLHHGSGRQALDTSMLSVSRSRMQHVAYRRGSLHPVECPQQPLLSHCWTRICLIARVLFWLFSPAATCSQSRGSEIVSGHAS